MRGTDSTRNGLPGVHGIMEYHSKQVIIVGWAEGLASRLRLELGR
jgi:hypothetical protein